MSGWLVGIALVLAAAILAARAWRQTTREAFDDGEMRHVWVLSLMDETVRGKDRGMSAIYPNLRRNGLGRAEVFPAVDGRSLTATDLAEHPSGTARGVVGCYASHVKMWERASRIQPHTEMILILEDDVRVLRHITREEIPRGFDIVYLGHMWEDEKAPVVTAGFRRSVNPITTRAYVITPASARKLLRLHTRAYAIDIELLQLVRSGKITAASAVPPWIGVISTEGSSIARVSGCRGEWKQGRCVDDTH